MHMYGAGVAFWLWDVWTGIELGEFRTLGRFGRLGDLRCAIREFEM
jgi:hypothetical protein